MVACWNRIPEKKQRKGEFIFTYGVSKLRRGMAAGVHVRPLAHTFADQEAEKEDGFLLAPLYFGLGPRFSGQ